MARYDAARGRQSRYGQDSRLGATRPQFADEIADTIDEGIAGRGCRLRSIRPGGRCGRGRRRWRDGSDDHALHAALENECGPHANAPHQNDHPRIDLWLDFGVGVIDQRRHEDLIDGFFPGGGRFDSCGLDVRLCVGSSLACILGGCELADFRLRWKSCSCSL